MKIGETMKNDLNINLQIQSDFSIIEQDIKDINDMIIFGMPKKRKK